IDFVFTRFPIDGVSMQSADMGRCTCSKCKPLGDIEYHSKLYVMTADYIRSQWPDKTVGLATWGMDLKSDKSLEPLVEMSKHIDYLIDFNDSSAGSSGRSSKGNLTQANREHRRKLIESLKCDFGTLGGPQPEPPQHWQRDRWFLPTLRRTGD